MRELTIGKNDAGVRLDRFVSKALPLLPPALMQKYIRPRAMWCNYTSPTNSLTSRRRRIFS